METFNGILQTDFYKPELKNISETLLVPLFFKAKETMEDGLIKDYAAIEIIQKMDYDFSRMKEDCETQQLIAIRTKILDDVITDYIKHTDNPVIINLGAGLDTRHLRFTGYPVKWYQLDLEKPIQLRKAFFRNEGTNISKDIFDFTWLDEISEHENVIIIVEGVSMYLQEEQVKTLFRQIGFHFKNSKIAFDTIPEELVKTKKHQSIDMKTAPFQWGNTSVSTIETWGYGFWKIQEIFYRDYGFPHRQTGFKVALMKIN